MNVRAMEEGAILLKNEGGVLPLGEGAKVNLFGYASVDVTEAVGSATATGSTLEKYNFKKGFEAAGLSVNQDLYDLQALKADGFTVVLLINSTSVIELPEVDDYKLDACVFMGTPGAVGTIGIGNLLQGRANFSGKTTDTFAYDMSDAPAKRRYSAWVPFSGVIGIGWGPQSSGR